MARERAIDAIAAWEAAAEHALEGLSSLADVHIAARQAVYVGGGSLPEPPLSEEGHPAGVIALTRAYLQDTIAYLQHYRDVSDL